MARWFYYKANGSGWLHVDGTVYRAENMDEALDMLDGIAPCLCGDFVSPLRFLWRARIKKSRNGLCEVILLIVFLFHPVHGRHFAW